MSDGVLGSSLKFIDADMYVHTIDTILVEHNVSHSGAAVDKVPEKVY